MAVWGSWNPNSPFVLFNPLQGECPMSTQETIELEVKTKRTNGSMFTYEHLLQACHNVLVASIMCRQSPEEFMSCQYTFIVMERANGGEIC